MVGRDAGVGQQLEAAVLLQRAGAKPSAVQRLFIPSAKKITRQGYHYFTRLIDANNFDGLTTWIIVP